MIVGGPWEPGNESRSSQPDRLRLLTKEQSHKRIVSSLMQSNENVENVGNV